MRAFKSKFRYAATLAAMCPFLLGCISPGHLTVESHGTETRNSIVQAEGSVTSNSVNVGDRSWTAKPISSLSKNDATGISPSVLGQSNVNSFSTTQHFSSTAPSEKVFRQVGLSKNLASDQGQGIVVLTTTGELYRILPGTSKGKTTDTLQPIPFIPLIPEKGNVNQAQTDRTLAVKNYSRNFNALATGPDGTMYVTENGKGGPSCGNGTTQFRIWKLPPGETTWTLQKTWSMDKRKGEVDISSIKPATLQNALRGMCIQGGGVNPQTGNYVIGGTVPRSSNKKDPIAYYLFEIDKNSGTVTPRGWVELENSLQLSNQSVATQTDGGIIFDSSGNLVIAAGASNGNGGIPMLKKYTVPKQNIVGDKVDAQIEYTSTPEDIPLTGQSGYFSPTGLSVSPTGNDFITINTREQYRSDTYGKVLEITDNGVNEIQSMPVMVHMKSECSPTPVDSIWEHYSMPFPSTSSLCPGSVSQLALWNTQLTDIGWYHGFGQITLQKNITSRGDNDQFKLVLDAQNSGTWSKTTTGNSTGVQLNSKIDQKTVLLDTALTVSETIQSNSNRTLENDYKVSLECRDGDRKTIKTSDLVIKGKIASAKVTLPTTSANSILDKPSFTCEFTNEYQPPRGEIKLTKIDSENSSLKLKGAVFELYIDGNRDGKYQADQDTLVQNSSRISDKSGVVSWSNLKYGRYLVKEVKPPAGYQLTAKKPDGYYPVVLNSSLQTGNVLNDAIKAKGSAGWKKVDDANPANPLGGSEWALTAPDGKTYTITDCVTNTTCPAPKPGQFVDTDPAKGSFNLSNQLPWGDYTLKESKAPVGFVLTENSYKFTINKSTLQYTIAEPIVNAKATPPNLPFTGGLSSDIFRLGALATFTVAAISVLTLRRRKAVR